MDETTKKNVEAYDKTVEKYHEYTKDIILIEWMREFQKMLPEKEKILDLACGTGRDAKRFTEQGFEVVGVDLSPQTIEKAKTIAPKAKFELMDARDLTFAENTFDAVWFCAGITVVPKKDAQKILKNIGKVLKPDGILSISSKEGTGEGFEFHKKYDLEKYFAYYTKEELTSLLEKNGFEIIKTGKTMGPTEYYTGPWIYVIAKSNKKSLQRQSQ